MERLTPKQSQMYIFTNVLVRSNALVLSGGREGQLRPVPYFFLIMFH